jgi:hypothetical protein
MHRKYQRFSLVVVDGIRDMAVTRHVDAQTIGSMYAELVRDDPAVRGIYVREDSDLIELWVLTTYIEIGEEEHFYGAGVTLQTEVPDTYVMIRLANPRHFAPDYDLVKHVIPSRAIAIPLPA